MYLSSCQLQEQTTWYNQKQRQLLSTVYCMVIELMSVATEDTLFCILLLFNHQWNDLLTACIRIKATSDFFENYHAAVQKLLSACLFWGQTFGRVTKHWHLFDGEIIASSRPKWCWCLCIYLCSGTLVTRISGTK